MAALKSKEGTGFAIPISVFLGGIGGGAAFPIIPLIGVKYHLSAALIGIILSAPRASRLLVSQPAGIFVDKVGGKLPLAVGLAIESIGSFFYVLALSSQMTGLLLLIGRIIFGIGSALLLIGANTLALNLSNHANRGRSTASVRTAQGLGMPGGLIVGGILAGFFGEHVAFWASSLVALFGAGLVMYGVKEVPHSTEKRDDPGLLYSLKVSFKNPSFLVVCLFNTLIFFSMQGVLLTTLVLFTEERGLSFWGLKSQAVSGITMSFLILSSAGISMIVGRIIDKTRTRTLINFPALGGLIAGYVLLALTHNLLILISSLILLGMSMGATNIPLITVLGDITPQEIRGKSVAVYQFFGDIGGTLGPIVGVQLAMSWGFTPTYLAVAGILLLSLPLLFLVYHAELRNAKAMT